jgi:hypothetical protein
VKFIRFGSGSSTTISPVAARLLAANPALTGSEKCSIRPKTQQPVSFFFFRSSQTTNLITRRLSPRSSSFGVVASIPPPLVLTSPSPCSFQLLTNRAEYWACVEPTRTVRRGACSSICELLPCVAQNGSFSLGTVLLIRYGKVGCIQQYPMMVWTHQLSWCESSILLSVIS